MELQSRKVGLAVSHRYERAELKDTIDSLCCGMGYSIPTSGRILIKPNLVASSGHTGLAVTNPEFVAAVAEWYLDHGATVAIGDSPAFGSGRRVMDMSGITEALKGLSVTQLNFSRKKPVKTAGGFSVIVAGEIFDYDEVINLPKLKAHDQLCMTMAVKNYFGVVLGWRKAMAHMNHGGDSSFVQLLVDLLDIIPGGISIIDGIVGMHMSGPVSGQPIDTAILGVSVNPVGLDTALLETLGVTPGLSPLWGECERRNIIGCRSADLEFTGLNPVDLSAKGFCLPIRLSPIRFNPVQIFMSSIKRIFT